MKNHRINTNNIKNTIINVSFRVKLSKNLRLIIGALFLIVLTTACGGNDSNKKNKAKSIEQIHREEGVPVRIKEISNIKIDKELTFLATMSGIQETTVLSMLSDKIEKVNVRVGQRVSAGQILVTFPTDNAQLQWEQAKTALENSKKTYDRMRNLLAAGETSQASFDGAETQYLVAKQSFESLKKMVYIDAPFSGIVTNIPVKVGDRVAPGAKLVTVAQTGTIVAKLWVSESEVRSIKMSQIATVEINKKTYTGKVAVIGLGMDPDKRAFLVEVHFNNNKGEIKSGTTCTLTLEVDKSSDAIMVPRRVVQINADEKYVYIAENGIARKILVTTGLEAGIDVEITSGLKNKNQVITEGVTLLEDGKKIKIIK